MLSFVLRKMEHLFLHLPLRNLYFYGPRIHSQFGFWGGAENAAICYVWTDTEVDFWLKHPIECADMVEKHFFSFYTTLRTVLYFYSVFKIIQLFLWYITFYRPLVKYLNGFSRQNYFLNPKIKEEEENADFCENFDGKNDYNRSGNE
tara:strand:+ start:19 stop:459 length:441 start_codon:yes stop_codon:yes gene_type:complete